MANGQTFKELREIVADEKDMPVKTSLRVIMAALADEHESTAAHRKEVLERLVKIEGVTKYPSALWYWANEPLKTLAFFVLVALVMVFAFVPEARSWAGESILKTLLGGL